MRWNRVGNYPCALANKIFLNLKHLQRVFSILLPLVDEVRHPLDPLKRLAEGIEPGMLMVTVLD